MNSMFSQIMMGGLAFSTAFLLELIGRDSLALSSYWATVLLSVAVPLWMLTWMLLWEIALVRPNKVSVWKKRIITIACLSIAVTLLGVACELFRVLGILSVLFGVVVILACWLMTKIDVDQTSDIEGTDTSSPFMGISKAE